jgi:two-component system, NtrC family, sensor kinase
VLMDEGGKVSFWNPAARTMFGYASEEAIGKEIHTLIVPEAYRNRFREGLKGFQQTGPEGVIGKTLELYAVQKSGSEIPVEISISALQVKEDWYAAAIIRDISERKAAEEELKKSQQIILQQEKMASIGQLAAGVAHEINNPTGFVLSNLGTLVKHVGRLNEFLDAQSHALKALNDDSVATELAATRKKLKIDYIREDIGDIITESLDGLGRIKNIVASLKGFARVGEKETQMVDINECLDMTLNIVWNELKYKCTLQKKYSDLPPTLCYPQQLSQVFVNILVNAAHAIEKQGEIRIKTYSSQATNFINISDTGSGIPPEHINQIFDPFFTTKEVGQGTGLGLSIAYDIIKKHSGNIKVNSEIGRGTSFLIELPVANAQE